MKNFFCFAEIATKLSRMKKKNRKIKFCAKKKSLEMKRRDLVRQTNKLEIISLNDQ